MLFISVLCRVTQVTSHLIFYFILGVHILLNLQLFFLLSLPVSPVSMTQLVFCVPFWDLLNSQIWRHFSEFILSVGFSVVKCRIFLICAAFGSCVNTAGKLQVDRVDCKYVSLCVLECCFENHEPWISDEPPWLQLSSSYLMWLSLFGQSLTLDGHITSLASGSFLDFLFYNILNLITNRNTTNSVGFWMFDVRAVY